MDSKVAQVNVPANQILSGRMILILLVITAAVYYLKSSRLLGGHKHVPPGPKGWPFVGNIFDILSAANSKTLHLLFEGWAREYGDVMLVRSGFEDEYYVNTRRAAKALMDTNAAASSDRPPWIVSERHICGGLNLLFLSAGNQVWKDQRRLTNLNLTSVGRAEEGVPYLEFEALKFIHEVAHDPLGGTEKQDLWNKMGRYIYSSFTTQLFGLEIRDSESPSIGYLYETGAAQIGAINPGAEIVHSFPILDKLPNVFRKSQVLGDGRFKRDVAWSLKRLEYLRSLMAEGRAPNCFLSRILQDEKQKGSEAENAYLAMMLVLGASDTSRLAAWAFMEMMLENPNKFRQLQKLVDDHCGDRLPMWSDYQAIPYVRCVMKEVWRLRPPISLGMLAHSTTKDLHFDDYVIPKGSCLKLNAWAIGHDPGFYQDPRAFRPERFEGDLTNPQESANSKEVNERDHFAFGIGRRTCPGMHVAERSTAIAIMRLVWAFDIKPSSQAKFPIQQEDFPHYIPGNAGVEMPINVVPRNANRTQQVDKYFEEALASRPRYGSIDLD